MGFDWTGRIDSGAKGRRIHEVVHNKSIDHLKSAIDNSIGIVGFKSDEGVRRNQGRVGAAAAPNKIRKQLANLPYHSNNKNVIDVGNVTCDGTELEQAQTELGNCVSVLIDKNYTPVILGGGHETLFGHYLGVRKALGKDKKIGIINLDAHFDLRIDDQATSGTMFRQILETDKHADYLCVGLQKLGNTEQLFATAHAFNVDYIVETELYPLENTFQKIDAFASKQDAIIYTICTDVINQTSAPGVSAPAPFGLQPETVREISKQVVNQKNFISMDVSEVNPTYDVADMTSRLMGHVIAEVMMELNQKDVNK